MAGKNWHQNFEISRRGRRISRRGHLAFAPICWIMLFLASGKREYRYKRFLLPRLFGERLCAQVVQLIRMELRFFTRIADLLRPGNPKADLRLWSDGSKVRRSVPSFITPRTWRIYYCCAIGAIAVPDDMMRRSERMKYGTQNLFIRKGLEAVICLFFLCASFFLFFHSANAVVRPIVFPVEVPYYFRDDYLDPRGGGTRKHLGTDIIADKMKKIFSASDGVVTYVVSPEASWGYAIEVRDTDGYTYNYLHLNNDTPGTDDGKGGEGHAYAPEIENGVRVSKGQFIGWVGDSGNAEETPPHLHFEIEDPRGMHI